MRVNCVSWIHHWAEYSASAIDFRLSSSTGHHCFKSHNVSETLLVAEFGNHFSLSLSLFLPHFLSLPLSFSSSSHSLSFPKQRQKKKKLESWCSLCKMEASECRDKRYAVYLMFVACSLHFFTFVFHHTVVSIWSALVSLLSVLSLVSQRKMWKEHLCSSHLGIFTQCKRIVFLQRVLSMVHFFSFQQNALTQRQYVSSKSALPQ